MTIFKWTTDGRLEPCESPFGDDQDYDAALEAAGYYPHSKTYVCKDTEYGWGIDLHHAHGQHSSPAPTASGYYAEVWGEGHEAFGVIIPDTFALLNFLHEYVPKLTALNEAYERGQPDNGSLYSAMEEVRIEEGTGFYQGDSHVSVTYTDGTEESYAGDWRAAPEGLVHTSAWKDGRRELEFIPWSAVQMWSVTKRDPKLKAQHEKAAA
jgi:hypothetical protein